MRPLPVFHLVLDGVGTVLFATGALAYLGMDFGHPVLQTVAPVLLGFGAALMAPLIVWVIRNARSR